MNSRPIDAVAAVPHGGHPRRWRSARATLAAICGSALVIGASAIVIAQPASDPAAPKPGQPAPAQPGEERRERGPGREGQAERRPDFPNVEAAMKSMRGGMRALRDIVDKPEKKDEALAAVGVMERACVAAKGMKPQELKPGASLDDYRRGQIKLMGMFLELETQIIDGKGDQAKATLQAIAKYRDDSHEKFGGEEKREGRPPGRPGEAPPPGAPKPPENR